MHPKKIPEAEIIRFDAVIPTEVEEKAYVSIHSLPFFEFFACNSRGRTRGS